MQRIVGGAHGGRGDKWGRPSPPLTQGSGEGQKTRRWRTGVKGHSPGSSVLQFTPGVGWKGSLAPPPEVDESASVGGGRDPRRAGAVEHRCNPSEAWLFGTPRAIPSPCRLTLFLIPTPPIAPLCLTFPPRPPTTLLPLPMATLREPRRPPFQSDSEDVEWARLLTSL